MKTRALQVAAGGAMACAALALGGCASYQYHADGMKMVAEGKDDAALPLLRMATQIDPVNAGYRIDLLNEATRYAAELTTRGDDARRGGKPELAADFYAKALRVEPANDRAQRGLAMVELDTRNARLLADADALLREGRVDAARDKVAAALASDPASEAARRQMAVIDAEADKVQEEKAALAAARSVMNRPVTLQFRDANLRMVFEALARTTGLNVILDRDVRADLKTTLFVKDAAVEDTVDLILLQNQLEKRSLNANTLFVYPATAAKQKEYQDLDVRTFHVTNADVKYLQTVLKSVLKIKEVSMDEHSDTLVLRDTPQALAVAAKLIAAHDVPDAEVMLEVQVLEVSRDRLSDIGLQLPTTFGISTPSSVQTLSDFKALNRNRGALNATGLSATLNLQLQDTDANLLASPRIRARNKEKARILIGDRVPTITNTVTPVSTGTPVITGSVQYQEVGLKLEFEPQIYSDQEVGIKINLEVSNIAKVFTDAQGGRSYQIGTRNAQTSLRLRDGETQILGGLISDQDQRTVDKVPGLGEAPVVGALFSNHNNSRSKSEIVLSITPRIIRGPAITENAIRDIFSGTESSIRERALRLDPVGDFRSQSGARSPATAPTPAPTMSIQIPAAEPPAAPASAAEPTMPATSTSTSAAPATATPPVLVVSAASANPGGGIVDLNWSGASSARVGETFKVALAASFMPAVQNLPLTVRFDPSVLRFVEASLGELAEQAGAAKPVAAADAFKGRVDIPLNFSRPAALNGNGTLVNLTFMVKAGRPSTQLIASQMAITTDSGDNLMVPSGPRAYALRLTP